MLSNCPSKVKPAQRVAALNSECYLSLEGTEEHNCVVKLHPERSFLHYQNEIQF